MTKAFKTETKLNSGSHQAPKKPVEKKSRQRVFSWGKCFLMVVLLTIVLFLFVLYQTLFGKIEQSAKLITVEQGQSYYGFVTDWEKGVPFFSATMAKAFLKTQHNKPLHSGTYEIPKNPSFYQITNILSNGAKSALVKVQIIEGKRARNLYKKLRSTKGITIEVLDKPESELKKLLDINAETPKGAFSNNLEGWFSPNTYKYSEGTTDKKILIDLYRRQQNILDKAWKKRAKNLPYTSPYEALIMASIIEKETGLPKERGKVAAVFVNRLRKGMRLQTDPTIIYGMGDRYNGDIKRSDIKEKTAYNTYQINGLPPTPISLPSVAAIDAALNPDDDTKALFFVATGKGGHTFSDTYAEHKKAVAKYLKVVKANKK